MSSTDATVEQQTFRKLVDLVKAQVRASARESGQAVCLLFDNRREVGQRVVERPRV